MDIKLSYVNGERVQELAMELHRAMHDHLPHMGIELKEAQDIAVIAAARLAITSEFSVRGEASSEACDAINKALAVIIPYIEGCAQDFYDSRKPPAPRRNTFDPGRN